MYIALAPRLVILIALAAPFCAAAAESPVNVDITMGKIVTLIKGERWAETLPYFEQIEQSGEKLPESFYYYQIEALYKSGDVDLTLAKVHAYAKRYGKHGKYYAKAISVGSEAGLIADTRAREAKEASDKRAAANALYAEKMRVYENAMVEYRQNDADRDKRVSECVAEVNASLNRCWDKSTVTGILGTEYAKTERKQQWCNERYNSAACDRNIQKVPRPELPARP